MYLHAGNHKNIRSKNIIGIFDTDNATLSTTSRAYLSAAERRGEVEAAVEEIPKSFILTSENQKNKVYFSQLSAQTLRARIDEPLK